MWIEQLVGTGNFGTLFGEWLPVIYQVSSLPDVSHSWMASSTGLQIEFFFLSTIILFHEKLSRLPPPLTLKKPTFIGTIFCRAYFTEASRMSSVSLEEAVYRFSAPKTINAEEYCEEEKWIDFLLRVNLILRRG